MGFRDREAGSLRASAGALKYPISYQLVLRDVACGHDGGGQRAVGAVDVVGTGREGSCCRVTIFSRGPEIRAYLPGKKRPRIVRP